MVATKGKKRGLKSEVDGTKKDLKNKSVYIFFE